MKTVIATLTAAIVALGLSFNYILDKQKADVENFKRVYLENTTNITRALYGLHRAQDLMQNEIDQLAGLIMIPVPSHPPVKVVDHDRLDVRIGNLEYIIHGKTGILAKLKK